MADWKKRRSRSLIPDELPNDRVVSSFQVCLGGGQRGVFVVLFPFVVISLFGLIGLTLTAGNALVERTKLQTLLDAMALSAAMTVNQANAQNDATQATTAKCSGRGTSALQALRNTFDYLTVRDGYQSLGENISRNQDLILEYASQLNPANFSGACPPTDPSRPIYVRIRMQAPMQVPEWLMPLLDTLLGVKGYDIRVSGRSVAGPAPVMPLWNTAACPVPVFVCDRSADNPQYPPRAACAMANGPGCAYGYPKARPDDPARGVCTLADPEPPDSICWDLAQEAGRHTLPMTPGQSVAAALAGTSGACPMPPAPDGLVTTAVNTLPLGAMNAGLSTRARTPIVVPVLDCERSQLVGYLCIVNNGSQLSVVESGAVDGGCGAGTVIGGPGSRPREPGLLPPIWRVMLHKDPGASDS